MKKTKFNKKELTLFGSILQNRIKEQKKELKSVNKLLKDQRKFRASTDLKDDHDASITRNGEMLKSMRNRIDKRLSKLNSALDRVHNKTYGICSKTGKMISKKRLLVLPQAETIIKK